MAENELKAKGNAAFSDSRYEEAIDFFTQAIVVNPHNHVLYSNRSAAQASIKAYDKALEDAKKVVDLKPEWIKGYSRLGAALHGLEKYEEAIDAFDEGLKLEAGNAALSEGKEQAQAAMKKARKSSPFTENAFLSRLMADPRTAPLMARPDFMTMIKDLQAGPENMAKYIADPRMQLVMEVGLGISLSTTAGEASKNTKPEATGETPEVMEVEPEAEAAPVMEEVSEENAKEHRKTQALEEKDKGNAAYKKKHFDEAIQHYTKAIELNDEDMTFLTNRAAVYLEMGDYEECMKDCDAAVERGRELHADFKLIAKALTRKGKALMKLGRRNDAVDVFNQSLTEHRTADTLNALREAEKLLKDDQEQEYVDLDLSAKEKESGNAAFKLQQYPEAVKFYSEALKRGPPAYNGEAYKIYSNRAACYTKLGALHEALKDAEKCIDLKPDFGKGYSRKAHVHFFMKEYEKSMEAYKKGLECDPDSEEMKEGIQKCTRELSRIARGELSEADMQERRNRAMADPEIQQILTDPVMAQVLKDFEADPRGAQKHLQNPEIMSKLNKLMTAGIIKVQ